MSDPSDLSLEERCRLLGGASTWRTHPIDRLGIPAVKMSDGPNGVRGDSVGAEKTPGVAVPVGIALGATWNPALVGELGDLLGREAVRKGAHVLLAPTVNLQRTPIGGRVFECYSEDPELTARLAVELVKGVQAHHVAVTVKHLVANDTEVDRFTVDVAVDERTRRELYLRPFEAVVKEASAWGVMAAYNRVDGEFCAGNRRLLTSILRDEWGFDGVVVSDWLGSHDTVASATAGLNVPMPGPATIYGEPLKRAVLDGDVDEATVDGLVGDVLRLIDRTRGRERSSERPEQSVDEPAERALCRRAVAEGAVLLKNTSALPLRPGLNVALIGPNASDTRIMGGGSSSLHPLPTRSILEALSARVEHLVHEPGVRIDRLPPPASARSLRTPDGRPGLVVDYRNGDDFDAPVVTSDVSSSTIVRYFGSTPAGVEPQHFNVTMTGSFVPEVSGRHVLSGVLTGAGSIRVGDATVLDDPDRSLPRGPLFFGMGSDEQTATLDCQAGSPVAVQIRAVGMGGFAGIRLGIRCPHPADSMERAVAAAGNADVAVVVVGTNDEWETEGEDRATIALPGSQDELIRRVAAANPSTVVVINAGSPVAMPWIDDVDAVLVAYFGGYEMGNGVTDVLLGDQDPGGRLPITYPVRLEDTPAWPHYAPVDGVQTYGEGLLMGYRGFEAAGTTPLFPFGHGLSYGDAEWLDATWDDRGTTAWVTVRSVSDRPSTVVVQGYVAPLDPPVERAPKQLAAFAKVTLAPGQEQAVALHFGRRGFERWDEDTGGWVVDPGHYEVLLAASATDVRFRLPAGDALNPSVDRTSGRASRGELLLGDHGRAHRRRGP